MEFDEEIINKYINSLYNTIIFKDVVARNQIRDVALLERIGRFIADNRGNITSSKKVTDFLKSQKLSGSMETVHSYLDMLSSAFVFYKVARYDIKGKRLLEIHEKYYTGDIGIKYALLGYKINDISGHLENIIYLELRYRGYQVYIGKLIEREIDFIALKGKEVLYVQVCHILNNIETIEREYKPLLDIKGNYTKLVLSMDKYFDANRDGILWYNIIDFLLKH